MAKRKSGVAGIFHDDEAILVAAEKMRKAGYKKFDAITPFPVHGMEEAVGIKRSFIPWVTFFAAVTGCCAGMYMQYWMSAVSWALNVGGKPFFSIPAFIPVTFELTILFAALSSVITMFVVNGLPAVNPPIIDPDLTSHKFALWVPEDEVGYSVEKVEAFMKELGADEVKRVSEY